jgi:hypothetical protein
VQPAPGTTTEPQADVPAYAPSLAPAQAGVPAPSGFTEVVPGASIGPVQLGMSATELRDGPLNWQLVAKRDPLLTLKSGPYVAVLTDGFVSHVALTLNPDVQVRIAGKTVPPDVTLAGLTAFFTDCSTVGELGTNDVYACGKPSTLLELDRGSNKLAIRMVATSRLHLLY